VAAILDETLLRKQRSTGTLGHQRALTTGSYGASDGPSRSP